MEEIKSHRFFSTINWDDLLQKKLEPPFKPAVLSDEVFYFESVFTSQPALDSPGTPPSARAHEFFRGFSYVSPTIDNSQDEDIETNNSNNIQPLRELNKKNSKRKCEFRLPIPPKRTLNDRHASGDSGIII